MPDSKQLNILLADDDKVKLGKGGAMPKKPKKGGQAFILMGLPASAHDRLNVGESITAWYAASTRA